MVLVRPLKVQNCPKRNHQSLPDQILFLIPPHLTVYRTVMRVLVEVGFYIFKTFHNLLKLLILAAISRSNDSIIETKIKPEKKRKRTSTSTCANSSSPSPSNASSTPVTSNAAQMASHFSKSSSHVPTLHPSSATPNVSNFSNTSSSSSITYVILILCSSFTLLFIRFYSNSKHESNKPKKDVTSTKRAKRKKDDSAKDSNMDSLT